MANIKLFLDTRRAKADGSHQLKLRVSHLKVAKFIPLGVNLTPDQWNLEDELVTSKHPQYRALNRRIGDVFEKAVAVADEMCFGLRGAEISANSIADSILEKVLGKSPKKPKHTFADSLMCFASTKNKKSTAALYHSTLSRMRAFTKDVEELTFEDIDIAWLRNFDSFMATTAPSKNARNIHLRNIRAVFNYAIDEGITKSYPFRKFKIRPEPTRKRSLSVDNLRKLYSCPVEEYAEFYRDMFFLIFMLCGINAIDLYGLKEITDEGRIEYKREKTGRLYSVKVEPEALSIIEKYRGSKRLVCIADRWEDHSNFIRQINKALRRIGAKRSGLGGKKGVGEFPGLTTYWARHSWATVAAYLDIPKETIAAALGHGGNTVTDIYIDFDQRKVDEANRRVIDWVLYGKQ